MKKTIDPTITANPSGLLISRNQLPFQFRANDVTKHIVNIDSRFRQNPDRTTANDFYFNISPPVKNVLRIRVTSIEFPNNYPYFTAIRGNITLRILYKVGATAYQVILQIPDGNYNAGDMVDALNEALQASGGAVDWITVSFSEVTGHFTFTSTKVAPQGYFGIDATYQAAERCFDYGLPFNLGFTRKLHIATTDVSGNYSLESDQCATFAGDPYVFIKVNDFNCVKHYMDDTTLTALAKVVLREPKNYMVFDDYASQHAKEVVFPQPQNLSRLHIQVLDPYGGLIDLCSSNFSFSIEALEIINSTLYNTVRESLSTHYI